MEKTDEYEPMWLQKATRYIPSKHADLLEGAWIQLKVDGQAIQAVFNEEKTPKIYSNGIAKKANYFRDYTDAVPHIIDELSQIDFKGNLQGEIYADHLPDDESNFKYAVGVLKDHKSYQRQCKEGLLKFVIYDMPSHKGPYKDRFDALWEIFKRHREFRYVSLISILDINYNGSWVDVYERLVSQGKEGVVLYNQWNLYKHMDDSNGRNPGIWKIKASEVKEFCAIEKIEGTGKYSGTLGALIAVDGKGKQFRIGSFKLTDAERQDIWDKVEVPFIGEMRAASETEDSYRHPVMTRYRPEKDLDSWNRLDD